MDKKFQNIAGSKYLMFGKVTRTCWSLSFVEWTPDLHVHRKIGTEGQSKRVHM